MNTNKHLTIEIIRALESLLQKDYCLVDNEPPKSRIGFSSKQEEEIKNKILELVKTL